MTLPNYYSLSSVKFSLWENFRYVWKPVVYKLCHKYLVLQKSSSKYGLTVNLRKSLSWLIFQSLDQESLDDITSAEQ